MVGIGTPYKSKTEDRQLKIILLVLCMLGLTAVGVWTNIVGYAEGFLPRSVDSTSTTFFRLAFFCGMGACGLACMVAPLSFQQRFPYPALIWVAALAGCGAVSVCAFAFRQDFFSSFTLGIAGFFVAGLYYAWSALQFYLFMGHNIDRSYAVIAITLSLAFETLLAPVMGEYLKPQTQVIFAVVLPFAIALILHVLFSHNRVPHTDPIRKTDRDTFAFYIQIALASAALVVIRALTGPGVWGNARFGGSVELYSLGECTASAGILMLFAALAFLQPKKTEVYTRYIPAFAILIVGLFSASAKYSLTTLDHPIIQILDIGIECFSHLLFWVLVVDSISMLRRPWRCAGLALVLYATFAVLWVVFFENIEDMAATLVLASGYGISILALLVMYRLGIGNKRPLDTEHIASNDVVTSQSTFDIYVSKAGLTPREIEILNVLLQGKTRTDIAQELFIAENTVKTHVSHIYEKLGISSRNELFALRARLENSEDTPLAPEEQAI